MTVLMLMMLLQRKEEEMLATGVETKQMLVRVERVGRICPGQLLANGSRSFVFLLGRLRFGPNCDFLLLLLLKTQGP